MKYLEKKNQKWKKKIFWKNPDLKIFFGKIPDFRKKIKNRRKKNLGVKKFFWDKIPIFEKKIKNRKKKSGGKKIFLG